MSEARQKTRPSDRHPAKAAARRRLVIALIAVLVVGVGFAVALLLPEKSLDFQTLNGRWLRPDGGYVLEIRVVDPSGSIDAAYLNPRPINIAKAQATRDDPKQDQLRGDLFSGSRASDL